MDGGESDEGTKLQVQNDTMSDLNNNAQFEVVSPKSIISNDSALIGLKAGEQSLSSSTSKENSNTMYMQYDH